MSLEQELFFTIGTMMIFYTSILEYINLNKFSKKDIFKSETIYNKDLAIARIYTVLHFTKEAKWFLYPYMWTMLILSIIGTIYYFNMPFIFNLLTSILVMFFYYQYKKFIFRIAVDIEERNLPYTYKTIENELKREEWAIRADKVKLSNFTKETLDRYGFKSNTYGNISYKEDVDIKKEKILKELTVDDDIMFKDKDGNIYDVMNYGRKPKIRKIIIKFSHMFKSLNKEENISNKLFLSLIEAGTSSFIFYIAIVGISIK